MRVNSDSPAIDSTPKAYEKKVFTKDESICRIYVNQSQKDNTEYLKLYMQDDKGEAIKFAAFKTRPSAKQDVADYEYYDKALKQVLIKINRIVKNDKESLKVEFFDKVGQFVKSFTAVKVTNKSSEKSPDYVAFSKTLRTATDGPAKSS